MTFVNLENISPRQSRPYVCGIDPGNSGGLAILDRSETPFKTVCLLKLPTVSLSAENSKKEIDAHTLSDILSNYSERIAFCVVEKVSAMTYVDESGKLRGQGAAASFAFGKGYGVIIGILATLRVPVVDIPPSTWKMLLGLTSQKQKSMDLAIKMYPQSSAFIKKKSDDGIAESLLLAHFGAERIKR